MFIPLKNVRTTRLFVEMNRICTEKGEDHVKYYWPKPGAGQAVGCPKISCVKLFAPWNWVIRWHCRDDRRR
ncbi:cache domain-containing protein [Desulfofundulus kuznetsovii]|uniref:cache domain-containing protein n=1 Tax=Desulfofundulus kuznetsovii TaxID=58135 RepID=UPI00338EDEE8